jgi:hypothetical protein
MKKQDNLTDLFIVKEFVKLDFEVNQDKKNVMN